MERKERMKTCPNCNELVDDHVTTCFNCGWNFEDIQKNSDEEFTREEMALLYNATIDFLRLTSGKIYTLRRIRGDAF